LPLPLAFTLHARTHVVNTFSHKIRHFTAVYRCDAGSRNAHAPFARLPCTPAFLCLPTTLYLRRHLGRVLDSALRAAALRVRCLHHSLPFVLVAALFYTYPQWNQSRYARDVRCVVALPPHAHRTRYVDYAPHAPPLPNPRLHLVQRLCGRAPLTPSPAAPAAHRDPHLTPLAPHVTAPRCDRTGFAVTLLWSCAATYRLAVYDARCPRLPHRLLPHSTLEHRTRAAHCCAAAVWLFAPFTFACTLAFGLVRAFTHTAHFAFAAIVRLRFICGSFCLQQPHFRWTRASLNTVCV